MEPTTILRLIITVLALAFLSFPATKAKAQISGNIQLVESESKLWIEGSSTLHDIHCEAEEIIAYANIQQLHVDDLDDEEKPAVSNDKGNVTIDIPVYDFDCGRRRMNKDFYEALKAEDYSSISFEYHSARLITNIEPDCHPFQLEVRGNLSVAGYGQELDILVNIEPCEENRFRLTGSKVINMRDFGIDPPSALFGLIRADDELEVFFSLTAEQTPPDN